MLPASSCKSGKGHMAAMERLLAAGSPLEPSAEELAHESVAVKMVQREMSEADEANLLEEEDMHVFDREPLADRLPLVACNTCKKPVKASQYSAHAERCRSLTAADETVMEADGGANHKKPPRKARKKLLVAQQDNPAMAGERERLQSVDADDAVPPDSVGTSAGDSQDQPPSRTGFTNSRGQKRVMNIGEGTVVNASKAGRARKTPLPVSPDGSTSAEDCSGAGTGSTSNLYPDGPVLPGKRVKMLKHAELDVMCGVLTEQGAPCRHSLTCSKHCDSSKRAVPGRRRPYEVLLQELTASLNRLRSSKVHDSGVDPVPMTTKVYYVRNHHRMRAVLGNLFQEACTRDACCSLSPSPNSISIEQGAPTMALPALSLDNGVLDSSQQRGQCLASDKMQILRGTPDGNLSQVEHSRGVSGGLISMPGSQNQSDTRFSTTGPFSPNSQYVFGKARSVSPMLGVGAGAGVLVNGTPQPPYGGVPVT
ncbi:unnamed protein product [Calypogeia fissa]